MRQNWLCDERPSKGMVLLGYPVYFIRIIGFWKVLGSAAVLAPRCPRLKEWAYAGIFFNMTERRSRTR